MFTTKTGDNCIEFIVAGKPEYIDAVCLAIKIFAEDKGFNEEKLEDIELASKEACKIVICHKRDEYACIYWCCFIKNYYSHKSTSKRVGEFQIRIKLSYTYKLVIFCNTICSR